MRFLVGISLTDPPKLGEYHGLHVLVPIGMPNQCTTGLHPQHSYNTNNLLFFRMFLNEFKSLSGHTVMHVQVNLCQKLLFLYQLTNNMTDCSLNYKFNT